MVEQYKIIKRDVPGLGRSRPRIQLAARADDTVEQALVIPLRDPVPRTSEEPASILCGTLLCGRLHRWADTKTDAMTLVGATVAEMMAWHLYRQHAAGG